MGKISLIFLYCCLSLFRLEAQQVRLPGVVTFSGVVIDAGKFVFMPDVACHYGGDVFFTDSCGRFTLTAGRGDTLRFTYMGYRPYQIVVPDTLSTEEYAVGIFLAPDTLQLSEAVIRRRYNDSRRRNLLIARKNLSGVVRQAFAPVKEMDAGMNQKMMINEYARSVEMRGHVDVGLGVGTESLEALRRLRLPGKIRDEAVWLSDSEIDLLKELYYLKKKKNEDN